MIAACLRAAFSVFAVTAAIRWAHESLPRYLPKDWSKAHEFDSLQDWLGARLFVVGESPFTPQGLSQLHAPTYGHPPTAPFFFIPLTHFEKPVAAELIDLSTWFLLVIHLYVCARAVRFPSPVALTILLFAWALTLSGFVAHWHAIQTSEQIAFALVLCWLFLRRNQDWRAGAALAVAATFKLFPGFLFVFLLVARRFRAFFAAATVYCGIAAFMSLTFGFDAWRLFLKQQGPVADEWMGSVWNGSLYGIILRLLSPVCVNPSPHPTLTTKLAGAAATLVLLLVASILSMRGCERARKVDPRAIDAPFALFSVLGVFANPWVWNHYWVLLIQPAFVVAASLYRPFHDAFGDWIDEAISARALASRAAALGFGILGIAAIIKCLGMQDMDGAQLLILWHATKMEWAHRQVHLYEALGALPWGMMLVLCAFTVRIAGRSTMRAPGAALEPIAVPCAMTPIEEIGDGDTTLNRS